VKTEITTAVQLFLTEHDASEAELVEKIYAAIGDRDIAERLIEFVPLAFGRVILGKMGVVLPDYFIRMLDHDKFSEQCPLAAEPIWKPALAFAKEAEARMSKQKFWLVAYRSAEVDAATKAIQGGSDPKNLVGSPPIFTRTVPLPQMPKKRWQFWK
jgi:hypothetical protein